MHRLPSSTIGASMKAATREDAQTPTLNTVSPPASESLAGAAAAFSGPALPGTMPPERRRGLDLHPSFSSGSASQSSPESALLAKIEQWSSLGLGRSVAAERMKSALLSNTESLNLNDLHLTALPGFLGELASIKHLSVDGNRLKQLPPLPPALVTLTAFANLLENLPALPASLQRLYVGANNLKLLPALPPVLQVLSASYNTLARLPPLPASLVSIHVNGNELAGLPAFHEGVENVFVNNNRIDSLPTLPASLRKLDVSGNQVFVLPILPNGLEQLWSGVTPEGENVTAQSIAHWQSALESLQQQHSLVPRKKIDEDRAVAESQVALLQRLH